MMKIIRFLGIVCLISLMSMSGCDKENADFRTEDDTKPAEITEQEEVSEPVRKPASVTYDETISAPVFSRETGFYSDEFDLELSVSGGGEIRYTTDGSIPSEDSELYSESIRIEKISGYPNKLAGITEVGPAGEQYAPDKAVDKGTVIRAAVFRDGKSGPVVTNSYFTGINQKEDYNSLPVISLTTDAYNLFDYENGIYVLGKTYDEWKNTAEAMEAEDWEWKGNFTQKGREWERPVHMELFPVLDELAAQYSPAAPDSFQRFGPSYLLMMSGNKNITEHLEQYYSNGIDDIKKFLTERYQYWPAMLEDIR